MNWKGVIHDGRTAKYVDLVGKPKINVKGTTVTLSCPTPDVKIYYSTDGSTPAFTQSQEYSKAFAISKGTIVKAIAKKYGYDNSSLVEYDLQ
jgi:beta-glucosidase